MVIGRDLANRMINHARQAFPNEACGLVAALAGSIIDIFPICNADQSPVHFTLDSQEQLRVLNEIEERHWDLAAVYHSHTRTAARPSQTDIRMANISSKFLGEMPWIIVSLAYRDQPDLRAWLIDGDQVREEAVEIY